MVKYKFPFRWIPGEQWKKEHGQLFVMDIDPSRVMLQVSIDSRWHNNSGVVREILDPEAMHLRHAFMETLNENGFLERADAPIYDMNSVRCDPELFWSPEEHIRRFEETHPDFKAVAFSSNGNCGSNPYYVATDGEKWLHLKGEDELSQKGRYYSFIFGALNGRDFPNSGIKHSVNIDAMNLSVRQNDETVHSFASGIPLIESGNVLGQERLVELICEDKVYDLGHLFLFGFMSYKESWINVGYNAFFTDGMLDYKKVVSGVRREVFEGVSVGLFGDDLVRKSLEGKGYKYVNYPKTGHTGEFHIKDGMLDIVFFPSIYSHSMLGMTHDNRIISAAIRALANRAGGTDYIGAAEIMAELGCENAILCDNAGDVVNGFAGQSFFTQTEQTDRGHRSIFIFAIPNGETLRAAHLKPVVYPPQYSS